MASPITQRRWTKEVSHESFGIARPLRIRPGQLEGFKAQAAEILRITQEQDTKTLRYDWFIKEDGTECEVHEAYVSEEGLFDICGRVVGA